MTTLKIFNGNLIISDTGTATATTFDDGTATMTGGVVTVGNTGLVVGSSTPFSDSSGTLTLQNVDALDATTESTIEAAIDTLANLTSIQSQSVTFSGSLNVEGNSNIDQDLSKNSTTAQLVTLTITNNPSAASDAVRKDYVDNLIDGMKWKESVEVATTADITLSGEQTLDGVLTSTDRVLVWQQTDQTENGIYVSAAGAWARSSDADTGTEIVSAACVVKQGTLYADMEFLNTNDAITLGATNITFIERTSTTNHNSLSGLQGGVASEYYHLDSADYTAVSGNTQLISLHTRGSPTFVGLTLSALNVTNGIVQTNVSGVFSSSTTLPDGTTCTTQSDDDNSTKLATTAYADYKISKDGTADLTGNWTIATNNITLSSGTLTSANMTATALNVVNGIITTNVGGAFSSSTTLPDGTTCTTQSQSDGSTKLASTAYVDTAVSAENLWNRAGTTLSPNTAGDNISTTGLYIQDGLNVVGASESMADDASISLPASSSGMLTVFVNDEEYVKALIKSDNDIIVFYSSDNVATDNTDGNLCIWNNTTQVDIKNRLGAVKIVNYKYTYVTV